MVRKIIYMQQFNTVIQREKKKHIIKWNSHNSYSNSPGTVRAIVKNTNTKKRCQYHTSRSGPNVSSGTPPSPAIRYTKAGTQPEGRGGEYQRRTDRQATVASPSGLPSPSHPRGQGWGARDVPAGRPAVGQLTHNKKRGVVHLWNVQSVKPYGL